MTIENENVRASYSGDGATLDFIYNWRILAASDLSVILTDVDGVETTQVLDTDFTVDGVGDEGGGTVTMAVAPASGETLTIVLDPPFTQLFDLIAGGAFPVADVEAALDRQVNIAKRLYDLLTRTLRLSDGSIDGSGAYDLNGNRLSDVGTPDDDTDAATKSYVDAEIAAAVLDPTTQVSSFAATLLDDANAGAARTTLGATTVGGNVFTAASKQAGLSALGFSAALAAIFDNTGLSAYGLLTALGATALIPYANEILNADFQVWQRGRSRTSGTKFANDDASIFADQWALLSDGNNQVNVSDTSLYGYPIGCSGVADFEVVSTGKWGFLQYTESSKSVPLRGKTVAVSFFGARSSTLSDFRVHLVSWAGTANAPTRDIVSAWNAATTKPTAIANVTLIDANEGSTFSLNAGTYTQYLRTFVIPNDCNNLGIFICTNDGAYAAGDRVSFSGIQRSLAAVATPFQGRPLAAEILECQRFFRKTFPLETVPAQNTGSLAGALHCQMNSQASGNPRGLVQWQFGAPMFKVPTVVTYNPTAAAATWDEVGGTTTLAATVLDEGEAGVCIYTATNAADNSRYAIHATAEALLF